MSDLPESTLCASLSLSFTMRGMIFLKCKNLCGGTIISYVAGQKETVLWTARVASSFILWTRRTAWGRPRKCSHCPAPILIEIGVFHATPHMAPLEIDFFTCWISGWPDGRIPCVRPGIVIDNRSSWCFRKSVGGSRPDKKIID